MKRKTRSCLHSMVAIDTYVDVKLMYVHENSKRVSCINPRRNCIIADSIEVKANDNIILFFSLFAHVMAMNLGLVLVLVLIKQKKVCMC